MNIGGRDYDLRYDEKASGAEFLLYGDTGKGQIVVGTKGGDRREIANSILHEILEVILHQDGRAHTPTLTHLSSLYDDPTRFVFHFDHDYLCRLTYHLLDGLLDSGWFYIKDPRKDVAKCRGRQKSSKKNTIRG